MSEIGSNSIVPKRTGPSIGVPVSKTEVFSPTIKYRPPFGINPYGYLVLQALL